MGSKAPDPSLVLDHLLTRRAKRLFTEIHLEMYYYLEMYSVATMRFTPWNAQVDSIWTMVLYHPDTVQIRPWFADWSGVQDEIL